jgi:hypothetical protein
MWIRFDSPAAPAMAVAWLVARIASLMLTVAVVAWTAITPPGESVNPVPVVIVSVPPAVAPAK